MAGVEEPLLTAVNVNLPLVSAETVKRPSISLFSASAKAPPTN